MRNKNNNYSPCYIESHLSHLNLTSNLRAGEAGHRIGSHFFQIKAKNNKMETGNKKINVLFLFQYTNY